MPARLIPLPAVTLIDQRSGVMDQNWYDYFLKSAQDLQQLQDRVTVLEIPGAVAAEVLLTSSTFTAVSELGFVLTPYSDYRSIRFLLTEGTVSVDGATISAQTSSNGGATYDSGANDYQYSGTENDAAVGTPLVFKSAPSDDLLYFGLEPGNDVGEYWNLDMTLHGRSSTTLYLPTMQWQGNYLFTDGVLWAITGSGNRWDPSSGVNAIRFFPSSGTFSGKVAVYGLR